VVLQLLLTETVTETRASSAALYFASGVVAVVNGDSEVRVGWQIVVA
jgi:hypothetical protein